MTGRRAPWHRRAAATASAVLLSASAACGGQETPAEKVPRLEASLVKVEAGLANDQPHDARAQLNSILKQAQEAKARGTLSADQANAIIAAAAQLLNAIPTPSPEPPRATGPDSDKNGDGDKKDEDEKDEEKKDKEKKDEGGNGPDPDDGHGN